MGGRIVVALALASSLLGCGEATGPEDDDFEGVLFSWDGGGEHRSVGEPVFSGDEVLGGEFAVAFPDSVGGWVLASFHPRGGGRGDLFILQVVERGLGTIGPCSQSADCHGRYLEDLDPEDPTVPPSHWEITDGEITIERDGPDRLRGSFTDLVLLELDLSGGLRTIEQGAFDVPLLSEEEGVAIMQCFIRRLSGGSCG